MNLTRITIIGLGLIGGSLAAASRKAFPRARIVGITRSQKALREAKKKKWIHEGTRDLKKGLRDADLVILCTPVDTLKGYLERIDRLAPQGAVVTDAGSVKAFLADWADQKKWRRLNFVGAHPMAGSHERGIGAAHPDLFKCAYTWITPGRKSSHRAVTLVKSFWKKISKQVFVVSPSEHDQITSQISHFPHLVASLLVMNASFRSLRFAACGFLDTTRVAQGDPGLWTPIFIENRKELDRALKKFSVNLTRIRSLVKNRDFARLRKVLTEAKKRRSALE